MAVTLVTGGAGFIGSHLVDFLIESGNKVYVLDNLNSGRLTNLQHLNKNPKFFFHNVDITDANILKETISKFPKIDYIFHLAALADIVPSIEYPEKYVRTNVLGTFNIIESVRNKKIKKFIYAASSSCYGFSKNIPTSEDANLSPQYPYALTKIMGEELCLHYCKVYKIPTISLRLFNVYGPRSRTSGTYGAVFGVFLAQLLANKPLTVVGDGNQTRDFTFVSDVVDAFVKAARSRCSGEIFNVGSGKPHSINYLVKLLNSEHVNIPKRPAEPDITHADISKISKKLNWTPKISFEQGVKIMIENIQDWSDSPIWNEETIKRETSNWFKLLGDQS